jgi:hypothetical protein
MLCDINNPDRYYYGEGRRWLEQALSEEGRTSAGARAKALDGVGWLASEQHDIDTVQAAAEEGLKLRGCVNRESLQM